MEQIVLPGHLFDHSKRKSRGLTEQVQTTTPAPDLPQVLGSTSDPTLVPPEQPKSVSRRTLALKRRANKVQTSSAPEHSPDLLHSLGVCPVSDQPSTKSNQAQLPDLALDPAQTIVQPSPADPDAPVLIHGYSVEEYQSIYHSVVDDMLTYPSGRPRPYSLDLGRRIKQRLWEKLNRPLVSEIETSGGLLSFVESCSKGPYPPLIDVDISGEPDPPKPERTRGLQTEQIQTSVSAEPRPTEPQTDLLREQVRQSPPVQATEESSRAPVCGEPASRGSLRFRLKKKKTRGFEYTFEELTDQTSSSSPVPEEEPRCKRPCQSGADSRGEAVSRRSLVLRFTRQDKGTGRPVYTVKYVAD